MPLIYLFALTAILATVAERKPVEFTKDSLDEVCENVAKGDAVLVDVRSQEEWDDGNIEGSIFLPVAAIRKGRYPSTLIKSLPEKKILYTFCVVGMRAKKSAAALEKQGFTVRALKPGYDELLKAGFKKAEQEAPTENDEDTRQRNAG